MSPGYKHIAPLGLKASRHQNSRCVTCIVGARFPCPAGWGTQRLRVSTTRYLRVVALQYSFRITYYVLRYDMSPLWSALVFGCMSRCYRHIAPLERNARVHLSSNGLGNPTPTNAIPLGLKGIKICGGIIHRIGLVSLPSGLGDPTPTGSGVCDNTTLRSSGARGLDVSRCYRHIAPLERKAPTITKIQGASVCIGIGEWFPRPAGWGTQHTYEFKVTRDLRVVCAWCILVQYGLGYPTPTGSGYATISHCAPLERGDWMCRAAIDISLLWSERRDNLRCGIHRRGEVSSPDGLGNPTPTNSIPLGLSGCAPLERQRVGD